MSSSYLLLWLEAPLQSWGVDSKFGRRDTLDFPTRSGVMGLICCAMGAGGEQREFLAAMSKMSLSVISYARNSTGRVEKEPLLRDFHVVGNGYDLSDPWQSLLVPKTNEGKKAVGGGSKLTYRYYLQDAAFAAVLEIPESDSELFSEKLQAPEWDLFLGRKSCAPTDFIYRGVFPTEEDAIDQAKEIAEEKKRVEEFRVIEGDHTGEVLTLNDMPVSFGNFKKYSDRLVTIINL